MSQPLIALDDVLPTLRKLWANPTPAGIGHAAELIHPRLRAMEESVLRTLPRWKRNQMDCLGLCGNAYADLARKVLRGPGVGGLGAFDPTKGTLEGWCWKMMWRQVQTDARQLAKPRREVAFPEWPDGKALMETALQREWSRRQGNGRITLAKEALRQAMDQFVGSAGNSPEAAFMAAVREGCRPTLREHSQAFGIPSSSLDRRRQAAVATVRGMALQKMDELEPAVLGPMAC